MEDKLVYTISISISKSVPKSLCTGQQLRLKMKQFKENPKTRTKTT